MGPSSGSGVRSEINVTPLVDVCLVLLIIFMVVTPLLGRDRVELPETRSPVSIAPRGRQIDLTIERSGRALVDGRPLAVAQLERTLRELHLQAPGMTVVVKADRHVPFATVREVLRAVSRAGLGGAGLATRRQRSG